ncbi:MAG: threonine--tRNA ligase, partial [Epsilonproteobacteria bacterium]|nr:threonine--tRNA ligase [Campylobacterota bacterium]
MSAIAYKIDNEIIDTQTAEEKGLSGEEIELDNSPEALEVLRHSTAHLMAQAIKRLYPDAEFYVGPVVKEGFYYDFKTAEKISESDLKKIEKEMIKIAKKKAPINKYTITKEEAREKFKDDHLKQAVLDMIPDENVSIYEQGDFEDLCRGPHLPNVGLIRNFKLTKVSGAYLGGDSQNEML